MPDKVSSNWITELIRTIEECPAENYEQRFGQLLFNLIAEADNSDSEEYDYDFHRRLFYLRDTELIKILKNYAKTD